MQIYGKRITTITKVTPRTAPTDLREHPERTTRAHTPRPDGCSNMPLPELIAPTWTAPRIPESGLIP